MKLFSRLGVLQVCLNLDRFGNLLVAIKLVYANLATRKASRQPHQSAHILEVFKLVGKFQLRLFLLVFAIPQDVVQLDGRTRKVLGAGRHVCHCIWILLVIPVVCALLSASLEPATPSFEQHVLVLVNFDAVEEAVYLNLRLTVINIILKLVLPIEAFHSHLLDLV